MFLLLRSTSFENICTYLKLTLYNYLQCVTFYIICSFVFTIQSLKLVQIFSGMVIKDLIKEINFSFSKIAELSYFANLENFFFENLKFCLSWYFSYWPVALGRL